MVAHLTLVATSKEFPGVDVPLPVGSGDALPFQVVFCVLPRKVPSCSDGFEGVWASIRPFSGFSAGNESCASLPLRLRLVGPRSSLVFGQNGPHNGKSSDSRAFSNWS